MPKFPKKNGELNGNVMESKLLKEMDDLNGESIYQRLSRSQTTVV